MSEEILNETVQDNGIFTQLLSDNIFEQQVNEDELEGILNSIPVFFFHKNSYGNYVRINKAFLKFFNISYKSIIGKKDSQIFNEDTAKLLTNYDNEVISSGHSTNYLAEFSRNDKKHWLKIYKSCLKNVNKDKLGVIGFAIDVTEEKQKEDKITYLSYYDKLTNIYNRAFFEEKVTESIPYDKFPVSIMLGDLNGLKLANDIFGHSQGDLLLIEVANILKHCCPSDSIISRWGGDEFAILIYNCNDKMLHEIKASIENRCIKRSKPTLKISIALGAVSLKSQSNDFGSVIREAEDRMYRNKLMERRSLRHNMISSLEIALSEKSHETEAHTQRVRELCIKLGKKLNMTDDECNELELLATLHDVGKVGIPDWILEKPGKLNDEEWSTMKKHPEIGYRIAESSSEMSHVALAIYSHHEHYNGNGYPRGLKGIEIPVSARILSVVDSFDVMTHDRPYKKAIQKKEAVAEIQRCSGTQFDPFFVNEFLEIIFASIEEK